MQSQALNFKAISTAFKRPNASEVQTDQHCSHAVQSEAVPPRHPLWSRQLDLVSTVLPWPSTFPDKDILAWLSSHLLCGCLCRVCVSVCVWPQLFHFFFNVLLSGMGKKDDPKLMQEWFKLVQEKNALVRYESELMILWVTRNLIAHWFVFNAFILTRTVAGSSLSLCTKCRVFVF